MKLGKYKTSLRSIGNFQALEDRDDPTYLRLQGKGGHIEQCDDGIPVAVMYPRSNKRIDMPDFSERLVGDQVILLLKNKDVKVFVKHLQVPKLKNQVAIANRLAATPYIPENTDELSGSGPISTDLVP